MDELDSEEEPESFRDAVERAVLAGVGLFDLARDRAGDVVGGDEGPGLAERAKAALAHFADELGLVTREHHEDLELKVAQLEHRLRLLEERAESPPAGEPEPTEPEGSGADDSLAPS